METRRWKALLLLSALSFGRAQAQTVRATLVGSGFAGPVFVTSPPADSQRLFVVQQDGKIRILVNGSILSTPFLDLGPSGLAKTVLHAEGGLLGLAFHPDFANNGFLYVDYSRAGSGAVVIERYRVGANPNVADPASAQLILSTPHPSGLHYGGCLQFGADGKLYASVGDGAGIASSTLTLGGKLLRLDVDLPPSYVPVDNPFVGTTNALPQIWHLGLRNPWRFSFDRATGDLWLADVGQAFREEIDFAPPGVAPLNFGWPCMEGSLCTCMCGDPSLTPPLHEYASNIPTCAVIGGYVYRGSNIPGLQGTYFYADYCSGQVWSFRYSGGQVTALTERTSELDPVGAATIDRITSFGEDAAGELYLCDSIGGEIYRIDPQCGLLDCNGNGIGDFCDLASGAAQDCNNDLTPDSCQIASGVEQDCNANQIPDSCDLASGSSIDSNGNGVPDDCDCAGGPFPTRHCSSKINSQLCVPTIAFQGLPSASGATSFVVSATQVINLKSGLLFYGYQTAAVAFQGGTVCVQPPLRRTPIQNSGGSPSGADCSGAFAFDFNAWIASGADPALTLGQVISCQYWSRDPNDPFGSSLTDAVRANVCQ